MHSSENVTVREAQAADAVAVMDVVRDSITRLCGADHRNDPELLQAWLANKTPENFRDWLANPENYCVLAESQGICGVGLLHRTGEIRLLYVSPNTLRRGVGQDLLERLEWQARAWGLNRVQLGSTAVARVFYESMGYRDRGETEVWRGILCYKYEKEIVPIT